MYFQLLSPNVARLSDHFEVFAPSAWNCWRFQLEDNKTAQSSTGVVTMQLCTLRILIYCISRKSRHSLYITVLLIRGAVGIRCLTYFGVAPASSGASAPPLLLSCCVSSVFCQPGCWYTRFEPEIPLSRITAYITVNVIRTQNP
jgi:hypothetical protein